MQRLTLTLLFPLLCAASPLFAQEAGYVPGPSVVHAEQRLEHQVCLNPWQRFHGFLFRRYAGQTEMETKTPYPEGYFGRYTYLPWKPDWVETPANQIRESQYRHHFRNQTSVEQAPMIIIPSDEASVSPTLAPPLQVLPGLHEVEVYPPDHSSSR